MNNDLPHFLSIPSTTSQSTGPKQFLVGLLLVLTAFSSSAGAGSRFELNGAELDLPAADQPIVLVFTHPECGFCVKLDEAGLVDGGTVDASYQFSHLDLTSRQSIRALDGSVTTVKALAKSLGVRFTPTLVFLDASGNKLASNLAGFSNAFGYGQRLEQRVASAYENIHSGNFLPDREQSMAELVNSDGCDD